MMKSIRYFLFVFLAVIPAILFAQKPSINVPDKDIGVDTLEERKKSQLETVDKFKVFHDFQFTDRLTESGITFVHRIVDDAGKHYKKIHYDHGNGIAVADVDGALVGGASLKKADFLPIVAAAADA